MYLIMLVNKDLISLIKPHNFCSSSLTHFHQMTSKFFSSNWIGKEAKMAPNCLTDYVVSVRRSELQHPHNSWSSENTVKHGDVTAQSSCVFHHDLSLQTLKNKGKWVIREHVRRWKMNLYLNHQGVLLTTWYGAVTNARNTLSEEAFPASLLILTVVYEAAALFGRTKVALVCAGRGTGPVQLPLADLDATPWTHSYSGWSRRAALRIGTEWIQSLWCSVYSRRQTGFGVQRPLAWQYLVSCPTNTKPGRQV